MLGQSGDRDEQQGGPRHPYLTGNFAPISHSLPLTPCAYHGRLPDELAGGQYVRNGGNPVANENLGRDAHWFDGDGMLTGVSFPRRDSAGDSPMRPEFVNSYVLTDVYLSAVTTPSLRSPILPSMATLANPLSSLLTVIGRIVRTILIVVLSRLWGSRQIIKKISVANTSILYHDGRALATCESGPPMRIALPGLETVGWFNGVVGEGESWDKITVAGFGGGGALNFVREWTTAHPRVDPVTNELILFHSSFVRPFVRYSIIPATHTTDSSTARYLLGAPVLGMSSAKMMHDFGVSSTHTVILDLPLTLDPRNMIRGEPAVSYHAERQTRFGVFPRWHPEAPRWFETKACCVFHTANTWDELSGENGHSHTTAVNMLVCRMTSASLIYRTGGIEGPIRTLAVTAAAAEEEEEEDQCRLYYYRFDLSSSFVNSISHEWALSTLPFEFCSVRDDVAMREARYVYGCTASTGFTASLGRSVKVDALVKMDVLELIERGKRHPPRPVFGCVDQRSVSEVLQCRDPDDPIQVFAMPPGWFAQEPRFVPRAGGVREDDGWLLSYVFDESQLDSRGDAPESSRSELWVVDARNMRDLVARIYLPQRVPYGLHGSWFTEQQIQAQRPIATVRSVPGVTPPETRRVKRWLQGPLAVWMRGRDAVLRCL